MALNGAGFPEFSASTENWTSWTTRLESHLLLHGFTDETKRKCAIIAYMGAEAFNRLNDKIHPENTANDLKFSEIVNILKESYEPQKNKWSSRINFRKMKQSPGESLNDFEGRLRKSCVDCQWTTSELQENLIEQFVCGLEEKTVQQAVLLKSEKSTKLSEVFECAQNVTSVQRATNSIRGKSSHGDANGFEVCKLSQRYTKNRYRKPNHQSLNDCGGQRNPKSSTQHLQTPKGACYRCGDKNHLANQCRYKSVKCSSCGMTGHLQRVCRNKKQDQNFLDEVPFHYVSIKEPICATVFFEGKPVEMEVDTGSGISTMTLETFRSLLPTHSLHENDVRLRTATGEFFEPHSFAELNVAHGKESKLLRLYLIDKPKFPSLIGRSWLRSLTFDWAKLLNSDSVHFCNEKKNPRSKESEKSLEKFKPNARSILQEYPNLTKPGIGRIRNVEAKLELSTDSPTPIYVRPRPMAHSLIGKTDKELEFLEKQGVIEKVNVAEWAHPLVIVPRAQGRKVRICADFKSGLNRFIKIDEHPLKNIRFALDNIGGGISFSKLDITSAFLHMAVRREDQKFLVVNTHRGFYRFRRRPHRRRKSRKRSTSL